MVTALIIVLGLFSIWWLKQIGSATFSTVRVGTPQAPQAPQQSEVVVDINNGNETPRPSVPAATEFSTYLQELGLAWLLEEVEWGPPYQTSLPYELGQQPSISRNSQSIASDPGGILDRFVSSLNERGWTEVGFADTEKGTVTIFTRDNSRYVLLYVQQLASKPSLILEFN